LVPHPAQVSYSLCYTSASNSVHFLFLLTQLPRIASGTHDLPVPLASVGSASVPAWAGRACRAERESPYIGHGRLRHLAEVGWRQKTADRTTILVVEQRVVRE
jgi:hypothetical protein